MREYTVSRCINECTDVDKYESRRLIQKRIIRRHISLLPVYLFNDFHSDIIQWRWCNQLCEREINEKKSKNHFEMR